MHILDRDAARGSAGNVSYGPNSLHDFGKLRARRFVFNPCSVGGEIHVSRFDPWHIRERLLDRGWAVWARHASDAQLYLFGRFA